MAILIIYFIRNRQVCIVKEITLQFLRKWKCGYDLSIWKESRYDFGGNLNVYHHTCKRGANVIRYDVRNETKKISVDRGFNRKRTKNCINVRSALLQTYSVLPVFFSNCWRRRDTYDVTIQYFGWCKNHHKFLTNQNKR